nr:MAG TPA: hypothetical protein [Caudoviricetes sp.]
MTLISLSFKRRIRFLPLEKYQFPLHQIQYP